MKMGIRSYIRDVLCIYVSYRILEAFFQNRAIDNLTAFFAFLLGGITIWFILEKIGLLPKS